MQQLVLHMEGLPVRMERVPVELLGVLPVPPRA